MGNTTQDTKTRLAQAGKGLAAYRGRFAPSPTGPLHFGSLVALLGSYLDARSANGQWHVRMEDIDQPRVVIGAADDILRTIDKMGIGWDGPVWLQSHREQHYHEALDRLRSLGMVYPCGCSRQEIADSGLSGVDGPVYPGTCRNGLPPGRKARSERLRTNNEQIKFNDLIQGGTCQRLASEIGDFVVRRADGLFAYQLAVVVDDAAQEITHIVRGCDLLLSTPRQIHLQKLLKLTFPHYLHLPVAVNENGLKLSKQTGAPPLDQNNLLPQLITALDFLGQKPPSELAEATLDEFWSLAILHWDRQKIPCRPSLAVTTLGSVPSSAQTMVG